MSLAPLLEAPWVIQLHTFAAVAAFVLGVVQFTAPKGTLPHKTTGVIWVLLMVAVTASSVFIRPALHPGLPVLQWFGWIHLFTFLTTIGLIGGVTYLMRGGPGLKRHKSPFLGIFAGGLIIAGALAFLPGRIMHATIFGS